VFCVWKCDSDAINNDDGIYSFSDIDRFALQANRFAVNQLATRHTGATSIGGTTTTTDQNLTSHLRTGSTATLHANGSALTTSVANANTGGGDNVIGQSGSAPLSGYVWELVAYTGTTDGDQTDNRTDIEENINSEYLIYQPTDAPTSGLLATYTGAAAAYSVRQLADTAVIAITVRRDSDDEEKRFGFDSNGDLDTTGIADFCTTANGYVSQWWDQSTNGNHASQGTAGSQPQIYNGTAVITENGKPAVQFDGVNDQFVHNISGIVSGDFTYADVMSSSDSAAILHSSTSVATKWVMIAHISTQTILSDGFLTAYDGYFKNGTAALSSGATRTDLTNAFFDGNQNLAFYHGTTTSVATTQMYLGRYQSAGLDFAGKIQESILWTADESSNRTGIQSDINTYFSIY